MKKKLFIYHNGQSRENTTFGQICSVRQSKPNVRIAYVPKMRINVDKKNNKLDTSYLRGTRAWQAPYTFTTGLTEIVELFINTYNVAPTWVEELIFQTIKDEAGNYTAGPVSNVS